MNDFENLRLETSKLYGLFWELNQRLSVMDTPSNNDITKETIEILNNIQGLFRAVHDIFHSLQAKVMLQRKINYHFRERFYIVRRLTSRKEESLKWEELVDANGPWNWADHQQHSLEFAIKYRNLRNTIENADTGPRGHRPGFYIWQIWLYDPVMDQWKIGE